MIRRTNKNRKWHAGDIEIAVARYFGQENKIVLPNCYYGLGYYEKDLVILTQANYAYEVEIKVSLADLKIDKKKSHGHHSNLMKHLYFAVPETLKEDALQLIPERAGLLIIGEDKIRHQIYTSLIKTPIVNKSAKKLNEEEIKKLYELAAIRLWTLKEHLYRLQREKQK